jgi:hypothetical protein
MSTEQPMDHFSERMLILQSSDRPPAPSTPLVGLRVMRTVSRGSVEQGHGNGVGSNASERTTRITNAAMIRATVS